MNREIKFRAWDDNLEVMFDWEYVMIDKDGTWIKSEPTESSLNNNLILMQYTGLKDKNGVEIYEGDIVDYFDGKSGFTDFIEWEQGCFFLRGYTTHDLSSIHLKVIGNIYENPELLS